MSAGVTHFIVLCFIITLTGTKSTTWSEENLKVKQNQYCTSGQVDRHRTGVWERWQGLLCGWWCAEGVDEGRVNKQAHNRGVRMLRGLVIWVRVCRKCGWGMGWQTGTGQRCENIRIRPCVGEGVQGAWIRKCQNGGGLGQVRELGIEVWGWWCVRGLGEGAWVRVRERFLRSENDEVKQRQSVWILHGTDLRCFTVYISSSARLSETHDPIRLDKMWCATY